MLKAKNIFGEQYQLKRIIDTRGLAEVWEASVTNKHPNNRVALKIFPKQEKTAIQELEDGFGRQPLLVHNNLLPAQQLGIYKNHPYIEMHICDGGNLKNKIRQ